MQQNRKGSDVLERALAVLQPRPFIRLADWSRAHAFNEFGHPYDELAYPQLSAPGGPMDAFDCSQYFAIWLQWGSRVGKTFFGQLATLKTADCDPVPMMFGSSVQELAETVMSRTYAMLEHCRPLRDQLLPKARRQQTLIELEFCRIYGAWSRSASTLADKAVCVGHANEIDKWEQLKTAKEADPLKLFDERFKQFLRYKQIKEGTPAKKGSSRVESGRLASCNAAYWVPCPHCGKRQPLRLGKGSGPGCVSWDKMASGKHDKELAARTARYLCLHCEKAIYDEHRGPMMRGGVWIPEGCGCNDRQANKAVAEWRQPGRPAWEGFSKDSPWVTGTPSRDGRDYGSQLSSLYALKLSWGRIAAEWVNSQRNTQDLRNFINSWLAETWEVVKNKTTWEQLGGRLIDNELPRGLVPRWASLLTIGIDRQEDRYPFVLDAWGPGYSSATIAYADAPSLDWILANVLTQYWKHADGGPPLKPVFALVDSGHKPDGIFDFSRRCVSAGLNVWPCKGSSTALDSDYRQVRLGPNTSAPGMWLYHVDTIRTQLWLERQLHNLQRGDEGSHALHGGSLAEHQDFLEQLLNDGAVEELDSSNNARERWERINTGIPNDFRDCRRYSRAAVLIATRGAGVSARTKDAQPPRRSAIVSAGAMRPDGRPW
jgi:phage terminase large subunit GpA-like protein